MLVAPHTVNLGAQLFSTFAKQILAPDSCAHSQPLGSAMRRANIPLFRYPFVRQIEGGKVGVFKISAITSHRPLTESCYTLLQKNDVATLLPLDSGGSAASFSRTTFEVDEVFPIVS